MRRVLLVAAALSVMSAFHVVLAQFVTGEIQVDAPVPGEAAAFGSQVSPAVAADGAGGWLVTWSDARAFAGTADLVAARVAPDGTASAPVRVVRIPAGTPSLPQALARLGDGTGRWLVAWKSKGTGAMVYDAVFAARLAASGALEAGPIELGPATDTTAIAAACAADGCAVAWVGGGNALAARVPAELTSATRVAPVSLFPASGKSIAVASDGTGYVVAGWRTAANTPAVTTVPLDGAGAPSAGPATVAGAWTPHGAVRLAFGGGTYALAWANAGTTPPYAAQSPVLAVRLKPDGTLVDAAAPAASFDRGTNNVGFAMAFDGTAFQLTWNAASSAGFDLRGVRLDPAAPFASGTPGLLGSFPGLVPADGEAAGGLVVLAATAPTTPAALAASTYDVRAARLRGDGTLHDPGLILVSAAARTEYEPAVAWKDATADAPGSYLVAWIDSSGGADRSVKAVRISRDGVVDAPAQELTTTGALGPFVAPGTTVPPYPSEDASPAVASDGTDFLVVWTDARGSGRGTIWGAIVPGSGTAAPRTFPVSPPTGSYFRPRVSFGGGSYLVAWETLNTSYGTIEVGGQLLSPDGAPLGGPLPIYAYPPDWAGGSRKYVATAFDGTNHLVFWKVSSGTDVQLWARPVAPRPGPALPARNILSGYDTAGGDERSPIQPAAACGGGQCAAAWAVKRADGVGGQCSVFGRVWAAGSLPPNPFTTSEYVPFAEWGAQNEFRNASVAWDGHGFAVTWKRVVTIAPEAHAAVWGSLYVPGDLLVAQGEMYELGPAPADNDLVVPALASDGAGRTLVVFDRFDAALGAYRVKARVFPTWADIYPPYISGVPALAVVAEATGPEGAAVDYPMPTAVDPTPTGEVPVPVECTPASGSTFPLGETSVRCTATDGAGNTAAADFGVYVRDTTPPTITASNPPAVEATGPNGAAVAFAVTAHDSVNGDVDVSCDWSSGSLFPVGKTTFACTARDAAWNFAVAWLTVEVVDTAPPALSTSSPTPVEAEGPWGAAVFFPAEANDLVSGPVPVRCSSAPGSTFPLGTTTVTCSATDAAGNGTTGTLVVTVVDTTPPDVFLAPVPPLEATGPGGATAVLEASAWDRVDGAVPVACAPYSGSTFPLGTTRVTCTAADASGNGNRAWLEVVVIDTTGPALALPGSVSAEAAGADGAPVAFDASASDLVGGTVPVTCTPASGSTFPLGTTTVACSAADAAGNVASGSFTVTVVDTTPPGVVQNADLDVEATGPDGAAVTFDAPAAADLVDGPVAATCAPASGSTFALGATAVACSATDAHGNTGSTTFLVTVADTTAPIVASLPHLRAEATGPGGAAVAFPTPSASDAVTTDAVASCLPASGSTFAIGTTTVTCTAADAAGNLGSSSFTVTVSDTTAPELSGVPLLPTFEATGASGATVFFDLPRANDAVDGAVAVTCDHASGMAFAVGTTTVACTAGDTHGNVASASFQVLVVDTAGPTVIRPDDVVAEATGPAGAVVQFTTPSASDLVSGDADVTCAPASGSTFALGATQVTCTATDVAGNGGASGFTVTVKDTTPPSLARPADLVAEATGPGGAAVEFAEPTAMDLVSGAVAVTCDPASGATFPLGTTQVACTAVDAAGNRGSTGFTVAVQDTTAPVLSLPADLTVPGAGAVTYTATATDLVSGAIVPACTPASGSAFAAGDTTVTCTATDAAGNTATGIFKVTVQTASCLDWSGLLEPVHSRGASIFRHRRTIPLRFRLTQTCAGATVDPRVFVAKVSHGVIGTEEAAESTSAADLGNAFRWDPGAQQWMFNLSTDDLSQGTWAIIVRLGDGVDRITYVSLRT